MMSEFKNWYVDRWMDDWLLSFNNDAVWSLVNPQELQLCLASSNS